MPETNTTPPLRYHYTGKIPGFTAFTATRNVNETNAWVAKYLPILKDALALEMRCPKVWYATDEYVVVVVGVDSLFSLLLLCSSPCSLYVVFFPSSSSSSSM